LIVGRLSLIYSVTLFKKTTSSLAQYVNYYV
jgi:hypothetical protein